MSMNVLYVYYSLYLISRHKKYGFIF